MLLPIYVYGQPVLRKIATEITPNYPNLSEFLANLWETMKKADGVGLAAPQVGESIRVFVIDGSNFTDDDPSMATFIKTFINAQITERFGEKTLFNEGCLSVPGIREDVSRFSSIRIKYCDENFNTFDEVFDGLKARIIQHEYDHLEGILLIDHLNPLKRKILKSRLNNIAKGIADVNYKMKAVKP